MAEKLSVMPFLAGTLGGNRYLLHTGLCVIGLPLVLLYLPSLTWLLKTWWYVREYSHGFLIPVISAYLIWLKREDFFRLDPRPRPVAGGVVLFASGLLLLAGRVGGLMLAEAISLVFLLPGVILFAWGWNHLKVLAVPLAYLQFMIPWMDEFIDRVHWPFQLLSANVGVWILQSVDIPALQEGIYIFLPNMALEVARECSGVRFLTSVIALGIPLVYLTQRTWGRAVTVLASGVAITILTNGVRVALVGVMAYSYGPAMTHGPLKVFQGWFVAQIGLIGLFLVNWAVCRLPSHRETQLIRKCPLSQITSPRQQDKRRPIIPLAVTIVFLYGLGAYIHLFATLRPVPLKRDLTEFPHGIGEWYVAGTGWLDASRFFPGLDTELSRTYKTPSGIKVHLYIGYFESQRQGKTLINHRANPLLQGVREIPIDPTLFGIKRGNFSFPTIDRTRYAMLSWYRYPSGEVTSRYEAKLRDMFAGVVHWRNNGAVILIATPLINADEKRPALENLLAFAQVAVPKLGEFLP